MIHACIVITHASLCSTCLCCWPARRHLPGSSLHAGHHGCRVGGRPRQACPHPCHLHRCKTCVPAEAHSRMRALLDHIVSAGTPCQW